MGIGVEGVGGGFVIYHWYLQSKIYNLKSIVIKTLYRSGR